MYLELEQGDVLVIDNLRVQHGRTAINARKCNVEVERVLGLLILEKDMVSRGGPYGGARNRGGDGAEGQQMEPPQEYHAFLKGMLASGIF